jgi:hypothetical protein
MTGPDGCPDDSFGQDASSDSTTPAAPASDGGFLSSITSLFSSTPAPSAPAPDSSAAATPPDPTQLYSKYFTLAQLTVTSLPYPNLPLDMASQNNLKQMAACLDAIQDNVGAFTIASCYRSPQNQIALTQGAGGAVAASMAVPKSYHSQGLAADITPTNGMSPTQFAQACYQNPLTKALLGQIVDKSEGGNETSLHISIQTPKFPTATPMYVGSDGQYYRMTPTEIGDWLSSKVSQLDDTSNVSLDQSSDDYEGDVTQGPPWLWIGAGLAAALGAGYWFWRRRRARG